MYVKTVPVAALAALIAASAASAATIDTFDAPGVSYLIPKYTGLFPITNTTDELVTDIGVATRTVTATANTVDTSNNVLCCTGEFIVSTGVGGRVVPTISYAFENQFDLGALGQFLFLDFSFTDAVPGWPNANMPITVTIGDNLSRSDTQTLLLNDEDIDGKERELLALSLFSGVDLGKVTKLDFVLGPGGAGSAPDYILDTIGVTAVPVPAALPLLLGGLGVLGLAARRRRG